MSDPDTRKIIGVVGAGVMGRGIAQVAARAGFSVILFDEDPAARQRAREEIGRHLQKLVKKGTLSPAEADSAMARIEYAKRFFAFANAEFVIEAVSENLDVKLNVFKKLDEVCPPDTILASNTSSLPITRIASATKRPQMCIGMHFMNPPALVPLLEIIKGEKTSQETFETTKEIAVLLKREPIITSQDSPGFIVNRVLMLAINEAAILIEEEICSTEDANHSTIMGVGSSSGMPILELADLIGIDVCVNILRILEDAHGPHFEPSPILTKLVDEGHLGRKSGRGFFEYSSEGKEGGA